MIEVELASGERLPVADEAVLGRSADCTITIEDPEISRRHAAIRVAAGVATVEDLGSRNGTFLNGHRVASPAALADGDEVRIGGAVLWIRTEPASSVGDTVMTPAAGVPEATQVFDPGPASRLPAWFVVDPGLDAAIGAASEHYLARKAFHLVGERGSGRAALTRALHEVGDGGSFVRVDCDVHGPTELETLLRSGSDPLTARSPDTLVLLEAIEALPAELQAHVAEVIGSPDAPRIVTTGAAPITSIQQEGAVTDALAGTLTDVPAVPPLRERRSAVAGLAQALGERRASVLGASWPGLDPLAVARLTEHDFPGNASELDAAVIRVLLAAPAEPVSEEALFAACPYLGQPPTPGPRLTRETLLPLAGEPATRIGELADSWLADSPGTAPADLAHLVAASDLRVLARAALAGYGAAGVAALIASAEASAPPAAIARRIAALAPLAGAPLVPYLLTKTEHPHRAVRAAAALVLGAIPDAGAEVAQRLSELAQDADRLAGTSATLALGRSPDALAALIASTEGGEREHALAAALALGSGLPEGAGPAIAELVTRGAPVPQATVEAALRAGAIAREAVVGAVAGEDTPDPQRRRLIGALAVEGGAAGARELVALIRETLDTRTRAELVRGIAQGGPGVAPAVAAILREAPVRPLGIEIVRAMAQPETTLAVITRLAPEIESQRELRAALRSAGAEILSAFIERPEAVGDAETLDALLRLIPGAGADTEQRRRDVTRALQAFQ